MFIRHFFFFVQTFIRRCNQLNACGNEPPRTRRSVLEPLEDRALLAVASVPIGHDVYCVAAPIQNAPIEPISLESLKAEIETTASDASDEIIFNLVDVSNAVIEEEADEDDSFIVNGKRFESYEALRVKHLVFSNDSSSDDSDDAGMNPRSGGSGGGEPETWDIEVTTSTSSIVSDLSGTYTNPLVEHRCGSGGATPLANSDYVLVTLPGLPYGYISDVTISQGALARASFYIASDSYYSSLNSGFQYSGGSDCLVYIVPKNDTIVNGNAAVSLGISEPYIPGSGGFEIYDEYNFNLIATSASATILDDDRWLVTVEASDPTATERLPDVEPDYGYYTFRREHEDPDIPGDTTYPVTIEFSILEAPESQYYNAQYGANGDYTLSVNPVDANDQHIYLANFTTQSTTTTYLNDELYELHHQFVGEIPIELVSVDLRIQSVFDWKDEGDLWLGEDDIAPWDQKGEKVELKIDAVSGFGGSDWEGIGDPASAEIEILDGAVAHIIAEEEGIVDGGTTTVRPNDDDDNENEVEDYLETGEIDGEDDLKWIRFSSAVQKLTTVDGGCYLVSGLINLIGDGIKLWNSKSKETEFVDNPSTPTQIYQFSPTNPTYGEGLNCFWREGGTVWTIIEFFFEIYIWRVSSSNSGDPQQQPQGSGEPQPTNLGVSTSTNQQVTTLFADIDIDSDNSVLGNSYPSRNDLEDMIEDDRHAPGKVIMPSWNDYDNDGILDCWEGLTGETIPQGSCGDFYPIILQIPDDIDLEDTSISLDYDMFFSPTRKQDPPATKEMGGQIRIWKKQGSRERCVKTVKLEGGDLIPPVTDYSYTPEMLGFTDEIREITLYVEGVTENLQKTEELAVEYGVPKTKIKFSVKCENAGGSEIIVDDVIKYVVAKSKSFYYELTQHPELLAAYVSKSVYDRADGGGLGYRSLNKEDYDQLDLSLIVTYKDEGDNEYTPFTETVYDVLYTSNRAKNSGFNALIYREYIKGKYILAFAGTNPLELEDWATDVEQAIGSAYPPLQYQYAMELGNSLAQCSEIESSDLFITGHSLGGGLSSAAAVYASANGKEFKTYTFNAAGLNLNTVLNHYDIITTNSFYTYNFTSSSLESCFNSGSSYIDAYHVDNDFLTRLQTAFSFAIPTALGRSIEIDSDTDLLEWTLVYVSHLLPTGLDYVVEYGTKLGVALYCHTMGSVLHGMRKLVW